MPVDVLVWCMAPGVLVCGAACGPVLQVHSLHCHQQPGPFAGTAAVVAFDMYQNRAWLAAPVPSSWFPCLRPHTCTKGKWNAGVWLCWYGSELTQCTMLSSWCMECAWTSSCLGHYRECTAPLLWPQFMLIDAVRVSTLPNKERNAS